MPISEDLFNETWRYDKHYHKLADFLGIDKYDREDLDVAKRASLLWDWAIMSSKGSTPEEYLMHLYETRGKLGIQAQGKLLLHDLYQYARLDLDRQRIEKKREEEKKQKEEKKIEKEPETPKEEKKEEINEQPT